MTLHDIAAVLRSTIDRQVDTTPSGKSLVAHDRAAVDNLMRNIVGNLAMVVDAMLVEGRGQAVVSHRERTSSDELLVRWSYANGTGGSATLTRSADGWEGSSPDEVLAHVERWVEDGESFEDGWERDDGYRHADARCEVAL